MNHQPESNQNATLNLPASAERKGGPLLSRGLPEPFGLYNPRYESDACGVGFVARISGERGHDILQMGLQAVCNVTHRGAVSADAKTGDGAGILTQIPYALLRAELKRQGVAAPADEEMGLAMLFLPMADLDARRQCVEIVEQVLQAGGVPLLAWRTVPIDPATLGEVAAQSRPDIRQAIVQRPVGLSSDEFERRLYLVRRRIERLVEGAGIADFYVPSFSHRTVVYKGLVVAPQLGNFYLDLQNTAYDTALVVFHQRYSTNTFPTWYLAQPFRYLGHNGEINTLQGNENWTHAREPEMESDLWGDELQELFPIIQAGGSDSSKLDNALELLIASGRDPLHAMMMLVPEAYQNMPHMDPNLHGFYEFHACLSEPWDGPAALAYSDGQVVAATLDRNGLRPARYLVTHDGLVVMASEVGVIQFDPERIKEKGRLGPGRMIAVDTVNQRLLTNEDIKAMYVAREPYAEWVRHNMIRPNTLDLNQTNGHHKEEPKEDALARQRAFGYISEDIDRIFGPMAGKGIEPVGSMGDDTPLAVLSQKPRPIYHYLKQRFAQVTNPPIDPLREKLVMSLNTALGRRRNQLQESPDHARLIKFTSPIITAGELEWLRSSQTPDFQACDIVCVFPASEGPQGLEAALQAVCERAERAVDDGCSILILSDREVDREHAPIPALLAVGAVHHSLIRAGKRMRASIVCECADAHDDHQFAALIGYGASVIHPYLAFQLVRQLTQDSEAEGLHNMDPGEALTNYRKAAESGILKIMSKMGISTVSSYRGAQIFEAVGLNAHVIDTCFAGTESRVGGVGFDALAADVLKLHSDAYETAATKLEDRGYYRYRHGGEEHAYKPAVFTALHKTVRSGKYEDYQKFANLVESRPPLALRDLLEFAPREPIPLEEVEPANEIVKRFCTPGMSHGALSREAHETLAIAMNRMGAKSNSGEGGEDPARYHRLPNGDWPNSNIKQVASGRFGVTPEYLIQCKEIEIKMAQGSKPGEGGQLPGHKVSLEIANIRHSQPGVTLISPPPHHDIYSIEDLSQLIYDLKKVNHRAKVAVKLVSEAGIGTVAAGVAKGYADVVHISGHDGGTGASPITSIKNAGIPWELGLADTQQTLVRNNLRGRITVRSDGGMKTGRDVVIAALLGAEEFGFGTAAVVAAGCVMARQCHSNTCPVGVASQRPDLRAKFPGTPDWVVTFFTFVAEQVREILASLGARRLDDIVGHTELLQQKDLPGAAKGADLDLSRILADPDPGGHLPRRCNRPHNNRDNDKVLDETILLDSMDALQGRGSVALFYEIQNTHRSVGAMTAGEIAARYGDNGLPEGLTIECSFNGSAGQSFGAYCIQGLRLKLVGECNDYVGKSMHGGEIVVSPPPRSRFATHENSIVGNTVMYGATGGALYAAGRAGERFCVRNSGGDAVVEGLGDHGCEYMTGGTVVVLGETGRNFGAGMSGGTAFVYDEQECFHQRYNPNMVQLERVVELEDVATLKGMIEAHYARTHSPRADDLLKHWSQALPKFWKVCPHPAEVPPAAPPEQPAPSATQPAGLRRMA